MERLSRRSFVETMGMAGVGAMLAGCATTGQGEKAMNGKRPPNVVLIVSDDQGSVDLNCYGAKDLYTPHLDALASRGVRFTQFYCAASICSPSRAALLTGRCPQRAGLVGNAGHDTGLPPGQCTLAELLRQAGYRTALFGKWHLGETPEMSPNAQGFDEFFGHHLGCIDNYSHYFYWSGPNRHDLWRDGQEVWEEGQYFPDLVVREAKRFLKENRHRPFFLYLPFNLPHYPMQGEEKFRTRYAHVPPPRAQYAAMVSTLDEKIGEIVGTVDALGLREDTIVVFLSDNGHSEEERAFFGGGSAGPYRGGKFTFWEGGVRLPCIVSWPGRVPNGEVRDQMVSSMDWYPTLARWCGAPLPEITLDGREISSVIDSADAASPHERLIWEYREQWAVREGDWKLLRGAPSVKRPDEPPASGDLFLCNLAQDPGESVNRASEHPDLVERLSRRHEEWR